MSFEPILNVQKFDDNAGNHSTFVNKDSAVIKGQVCVWCGDNEVKPSLGTSADANKFAGVAVTSVKGTPSAYGTVFTDPLPYLDTYGAQTNVDTGIANPDYGKRPGGLHNDMAGNIETVGKSAVALYDEGQTVYLRPASGENPTAGQVAYSAAEGKIKTSATDSARVGEVVAAANADGLVLVQL